jgi:hypothetical protein
MYQARKAASTTSDTRRSGNTHPPVAGSAPRVAGGGAVPACDGAI